MLNKLKEEKLFSSITIGISEPGNSIQQFPKLNKQIQYCFSYKASDIVSPEGNVYLFNASETTNLTSSYTKQPKYVSTYYIKSIVSPNRTDTIYLSTEWCIQHHNILFLRRLFQDKQERSRLWY